MSTIEMKKSIAAINAKTEIMMSYANELEYADEDGIKEVIKDLTETMHSLCTNVEELIGIIVEL